jgi:prolyl-tRNA synthetase
MANRQIALFEKPVPEPEAMVELEKVATPNVTTIEDLAEFLDIAKSRTAKAVFMVATITEGTDDVDKLVFAVVRGDMELNETKLANAIKAKELRPAHDEEIEEVGAVPGYASPVGLKDILVVVDDLVTKSPNLVAGANEEGFHMRNVNYGRDYNAVIVTDIVAAEEGFSCSRCGSAMKVSRGVEVGNIFKLGTKYTESLGANYLDKNGKSKPVVMGSYGIGSGRLMASVAEEHHDENGLIWPITIAPFHVHLIALRGGKEKADELFKKLRAAEIEVLYDDRDESPGVKFNDADLIGVPIRLTVSERSLKKDSVELKLRRNEEKTNIKFGDEINRVFQVKGELEAEIAAKVVDIPFNESE